MKRTPRIVPSVVVALVTLLCLAGLAAATSAGSPLTPEVSLAGGAPTVVSYQGQVLVGGAPYTGDGYFKFAIVNAAGNVSYWSNDLTSAGGSEPEKSVVLTVSNGLFSVLLGDTGLTNMFALPASAFSGPDRYLRVWFGSKDGALEPVSPDRRVAAAAYALQATDADLLDGREAGAFALLAHEHDATYVNENQVDSVTAAMLVDGPNSGVNADQVDGQHASGFANKTHAHELLTASTGLNNVTYNGSAPVSFAVVYGTEPGTAVQGNRTATVTAGAGLTGGVSDDALGDGVSATLNVGAGNGISVAADSVGLGPLSANWDQTAAYDLVLNNPGSDLQLRDTSGAFYGVFDVAALTGDQTYLFGAGGTVWTSGNDGPDSTLDADTVDGREGADLQQRVSGACALGSSISAINADGTVVCGGTPVEHAVTVGSIHTTSSTATYEFNVLGFSLTAEYSGYGDNVSYLTLVHELDANSPGMFEAVTGHIGPGFTLFVDQPGTTTHYLRMDAEEPLVLRVETSSERRPGAKPLETIKLTFGPALNPNSPHWLVLGTVPDPEAFPLQERAGTLTIGSPAITVAVFGHEWSVADDPTSSNPVLGPLIVTTLLDGSTPTIADWFDHGTHFMQTRLDLFTPGTTAIMASYLLTNALIEGIEQWASGTAGELPFSKLTLGYEEVRETVGTAHYCWRAGAHPGPC